MSLSISWKFVYIKIPLNSFKWKILLRLLNWKADCDFAGNFRVKIWIWTRWMERKDEVWSPYAMLVGFGDEFRLIEEKFYETQRSNSSATLQERIKIIILKYKNSTITIFFHFSIFHYPLSWNSIFLFSDPSSYNNFTITCKYLCW